jgi:hypothetical protein
MISIEDQESIEEATRSFKETLLLLSNDAAIIRQLSSLQIATGITETTTTATNSNHGSIITNSENRDPNLPSSNKSKSKIHQTEINKSMIQQLNGIHTILTQLESKVSTISHVLQEEQSATQALQQTKTSALAQNKIIAEIRQNLEDQELNDLLPGNGLLKMKHSLDTLGLCTQKEKNGTSSYAGSDGGRGLGGNTSTGIGTGTGLRTRNVPQAKPVDANANANANVYTESNGTMSNARTPSSRTKKHNTSSRKYATPQQKSKSPMPEIHLRPITTSEFQSVSKNIRRRITLSALNEALSDIQKVTLNKYQHLCHSHSHSSRKGNGYVNGNGNSNVILNALHKDTIGGDDLPFISEQEMRDDCAFFRTGESTARAILQILRSCKRIKQIFLSGVSAAAAGMDAVGVSSSVALNGNGALVTYVWLNGSD